MFLAAGIVTLVAIPPGVALGGRTRRLTADAATVGRRAPAGDGRIDGEGELDSTIAL
jgi:hypothetical protein